MPYNSNMEKEVIVAVAAAAVDFNFDSTCSSPYMTAPSSPQRFGNYFFSAPTSPSARAAASATFYHHFVEQSGIHRARDEEDKSLNEDHDQDFEFNFSGPLHVPSLSAADELFDGGKIRPLRPPSFAANSTRKTDVALSEENSQTRGRQRSSGSSSSSSSNSSSVRRESRSLPPLRVSDVLIEQEEITESTKAVISKTSNSKSYVSTILSAISFSKGYKKWKLKDLLFRSASEGREPLTKYSVLNKREVETADVKNASFRSTEGSVGSVSNRRGPVSAHELHYTTNRAVSEELKRRTYLPYKHGLLGCLGFNPAGIHDISRGVGSLTRG